MKKLHIFADSLFAHEMLHLCSGIAMFFLLWKMFGQIKYGVLGFLVSLLIDIDHYLEGLIANRLNFSWIFKTYPNEYWRKTGVITLLFHSWELLLIVFLIGIISNHRLLALSIVYPAALHYLIDNLIYTSFRGMSVLQYFLVFRVINGFSYEKLCRAKS